MPDTQEIYIHGFTVKYFDDSKTGIDYLQYDLDYNEAKVFFDQARNYGKAPFEDDYDNNYDLTYDSGYGFYLLTRR
ncbi:MAG: hypothetical protein HYW78_01060 [Parcubacteria group bacterium]|nr:hypothetical protein [Parcubacteria group bacterium]